MTLIDDCEISYRFMIDCSTPMRLDLFVFLFKERGGPKEDSSPGEVTNMHAHTSMLNDAKDNST